MSDDNTPSLPNLPTEVIYRILDYLRPKDIFLSVCTLCRRLEAITDTYRPYQVSVQRTLRLFSIYLQPCGIL